MMDFPAIAYDSHIRPRTHDQRPTTTTRFFCSTVHHTLLCLQHGAWMAAWDGRGVSHICFLSGLRDLLCVYTIPPFRTTKDDHTHDYAWHAREERGRAGLGRRRRRRVQRMDSVCAFSGCVVNL